MLRVLIRATRKAIDRYETRRKQSMILAMKARQGPIKRISIYQQSLGCITIQEARWVFQYHERWSSRYLFDLFMASTGLRACEAVNLSLSDFTRDLWEFTYAVHKPKRNAKDEVLEEETKYRTVRLDPFVREEFLQYLHRHCILYERGGEYEYATPWSADDGIGGLRKNLVFPWRDVQLTIAYWWKLRRKLRLAGFDVDRMERLTTNAKGTRRNTFVVRQHMWRGFACSIYYYQHGMDMKSTQVWIGHSKLETTAKYAKSASQLGSSAGELGLLSWEDITGYTKASCEAEILK